ncbi:stage III sporulation protein AB [Dysosmobacter sp.]
MVKLLGAAFVLGAGFWARQVQLSARRRGGETLRALAAALNQMAEEIRMARTPMPPLLACVGRSHGGLAGTFFQEVSAGLQRGVPLPEAWGQALSILPLPREELLLLQELGQGLQGDEERVCKAIRLAVRRLEQRLETWEQQRPEMEKRVTALWLSGAALLVILLI